MLARCWSAADAIRWAFADVLALTPDVVLALAGDVLAVVRVVPLESLLPTVDRLIAL